MGKVVFDTSMSLDGLTTGPNPRPEEPNGDGGLVLLEWAFGEGGEAGRQLLEESAATLGAVIAGRRTYDLSVPWWGLDGPSERRPVFVVTHEAPAESPEGGVYTFVTGGIEAALEQAQAAAGGKDVCVMGGASLGRQYLDAGLVDELSVHLVPVLLGDGTRMFDAQQLALEVTSVVESPAATHMRYRVVR